jgi:hypothetical protein
MIVNVDGRIHESSRRTLEARRRPDVGRFAEHAGSAVGSARHGRIEADDAGCACRLAHIGCYFRAARGHRRGARAAGSARGHAWRSTILSETAHAAGARGRRAMLRVARLAASSRALEAAGGGGRHVAARARRARGQAGRAGVLLVGVRAGRAGRAPAPALPSRCPGCRAGKGPPRGWARTCPGCRRCRTKRPCPSPTPRGRACNPLLRLRWRLARLWSRNPEHTTRRRWRRSRQHTSRGGTACTMMRRPRQTNQANNSGRQKRRLLRLWPNTCL